MISNVDYLLSLVGKNNAEIRDTWVLTGTTIVSKQTRRYIKDSIFQVSCTPGTPLNGAILYCKADYSVGDLWPLIDWDSYSIQDISGLIGSYQGVETPFFQVLLTKDQLDEVEDIPVNEMLELYSGSQECGGVVIDDEQLCIILGELGVPFLRVDELELTGNAIRQYCIKPAMDYYFGYFPIIKEESVGNISAGGSFKKEFPEGAFACVPYYVLGAAGSNAGYGAGAFSLYREQMIYGGASGSSFGSGVSYRKSVPGFVGLHNRDAAMQALAAQQGYLNYFRREHVKTIKENGKKYATGYSTTGGAVCIKWLCASYNFDDIKFSMRTDFRAICKAYVLRNIGMLRSMVKSDLPGNIDYSMYTSRADSLEQKVAEKWEKCATSLALSVMRGGL